MLSRSFSVEADGRVLIDGLDIFDPKQPFWENSKPDIKWPKQPEKRQWEGLPSDCRSGHPFDQIAACILF